MISRGIVDLSRSDVIITAPLSQLFITFTVFLLLSRCEIGPPALLFIKRPFRSMIHTLSIILMLSLIHLLDSLHEDVFAQGRRVELCLGRLDRIHYIDIVFSPYVFCQLRNSPLLLARQFVIRRIGGQRLERLLGFLTDYRKLLEDKAGRLS